VDNDVSENATNNAWLMSSQRLYTQGLLVTSFQSRIHCFFFLADKYRTILRDLQSCVPLISRFQRVLGLDVSPAQVAQAKQTVQADNLHFQVNITGHKKGLFSSCA
jgi:hypothetical protein